ncbi:hypothetical protein cypCar_00040972, partial [Cyprinus carpio]
PKVPMTAFHQTSICAKLTKMGQDFVSIAMINPGIQWEVLGQTANVSDVPAPPGKWDAVTCWAE